MILITGGAGFIGSNLAAALAERGERDVAICDRLGQDGKWRSIAKRELAAVVPPEALFAFLDGHAREIGVVFHMGAISSTTETDADLIAATNFTLSQRLWEWCAESETRFIYASSAATYGDGRAGLKFFNVYGPNEYHKGVMKSVVAQIYPRAVTGEPARLFRSHRPDVVDGGQKRDFVYVRDCVDMMLWLYDHPAVNGLFNIGSGTARSFADLAAAVFRALGSEPRIDFVDTPVEFRDKYQYFTEARMERLRAAGYARPPTKLEEGVRDYVQTYLAADDPYR